MVHTRSYTSKNLISVFKYILPPERERERKREQERDATDRERDKERDREGGLETPAILDHHS